MRLPEMPIGEPTEEDLLFDEFCNIRAQLPIPGWMPLVRQVEGTEEDWSRLWDLLLSRKGVRHGTE